MTSPQQPQAPVRTNVYVDGFNFYYGCLKNTPFKWLNIAELFRHSFPSHYQLHRMRYFTALVRSRPDNPQQDVRQQTYIRALLTLPGLDVHYGEYLQHNVRMPLTNPPANGPKTVEVIKSEEKGSDVNLATYLLVDAYERDFERAIIISDDSDLAEPVSVVRQRLKLPVTVLSPRGASRKLAQVATRFQPVTKNNLALSQFPHTLTDANGTITKPANW